MSNVSLIDGRIDGDAMTDEQIIKALECCSGDEVNFCSVCPCYLQDRDNDFCQEDLHKASLDLINRQKAEIESKNGIILKQKELIERTQKLVEDTDKNCRTAIGIIGRYERQFKSIKAEAVKEFAERLKEIITMSPKSSILIDKWYIDNLVKEMVGEG